MNQKTINLIVFLTYICKSGKMSSSVIDKQWMRESDRRTDKYVEGVQKFIEFVVENGGNKEIYLCPCT